MDIDITFRGGKLLWNLYGRWMTASYIIPWVSPCTARRFLIHIVRFEFRASICPSPAAWSASRARQDYIQNKSSLLDKNEIGVGQARHNLSRKVNTSKYTTGLDISIQPLLATQTQRQISRLYGVISKQALDFFERSDRY